MHEVNAQRLRESMARRLKSTALLVVGVPLWPVAAVVLPLYGIYRATVHGEAEDDPDAADVSGSGIEH